MIHIHKFTDPAGIADSSSGIELIYADDTILVLNKPSGLVAVPGRKPDLLDSLSSRVQQIYPDARIAHRLDMDTSGIMIMARTPVMQSELGRMFMSRSIEKTYIAVVQGMVAKESGEIDLPLGPDWPNRPRQQIDIDRGKPSLTCYRKLEIDLNNGTTRLQLIPVTGRTHQIRVHLNAIGHPILGDRLYAKPAVRNMSARLLLHSQSIRLRHPVSQKEMQFECECPF